MKDRKHPLAEEAREIGRDLQQNTLYWRAADNTFKRAKGVPTMGKRIVDLADALDASVGQVVELREALEQKEQALVDLHESLFIGSERGLSKETLAKMAAFAKAAATGSHNAFVAALRPDVTIGGVASAGALNATQVLALLNWFKRRVRARAIFKQATEARAALSAAGTEAKQTCEVCGLTENDPSSGHEAWRPGGIPYADWHRPHEFKPKT